MALREYIGEVQSFSTLEKQGLILAAEKPVTEVESWVVEDRRIKDSRVSFMHGCIAESLALGFIYKVFFEKDGFSEYLDSLDIDIKSKFPSDPDDQIRNLRFGDMHRRVRAFNKVTQALEGQQNIR